MKQLDCFFFKILEILKSRFDSLWCFACWHVLHSHLVGARSRNERASFSVSVTVEVVNSILPFFFCIVHFY